MIPQQVMNNSDFKAVQALLNQGTPFDQLTEIQKASFFRFFYKYGTSYHYHSSARRLSELRVFRIQNLRED